MASEGTINGNKFEFNGYFRATLIGFASFVIGGFIFVGSNVIANDKRNSDDRRSIRMEFKHDDRSMEDRISQRIDRLEDKLDLKLDKILNAIK